MDRLPFTPCPPMSVGTINNFCQQCQTAILCTYLFYSVYHDFMTKLRCCMIPGSRLRNNKVTDTEYQLANDQVNGINKIRPESF